jgi:signal transduction histidine kinase
MRRFASDVCTPRNIELRFHSFNEREIRLGADVRRQIFLVFKECIHNIERHSGCSAVDVEFGMEDGMLRLKVTDNGKGFDPAAPRAGRGLNSIRQRAKELGGEIEIVSHSDGGAMVQLRASCVAVASRFK